MSEQYLPVVVGEGSYNDLGLIRSLGEKGLQSVYLTNGSHVIPIRKSRYLLSTRIVAEGGLTEAVCQLSRETGRKLVLFPASDRAALAFDGHWQELLPYVVAPHACGTMRRLMDKSVQARLAVAAGFTVPRAQEFDLERVSPCECSFGLPCVVKPLLSVLGSKEHITVCRTRDELSECLRRLKVCGETRLLLQEYIDHSSVSEICLTGVGLPSGEVLVGGMVVKKRMVGNGSTSCGRFSPHVEQRYSRLVERFVRTTAFQGIFDLECFMDSAGQLIFIECNFRNGAYGYAASRAGVNLPYIFFTSAVTGRLPVQEETRPVTFMEERSDVLHVKSRHISIAEWLDDVRHTNVFLFSNRKDIGPMIRMPHFIRNLFPWQ